MIFFSSGHAFFTLQIFSLYVVFSDFVFMGFLGMRMYLHLCVSCGFLFGFFLFVLSNSVFFLIYYYHCFRSLSIFQCERQKESGFGQVGKWENLGRVGGEETVIRIRWMRHS